MSKETLLEAAEAAQGLLRIIYRNLDRIDELGGVRTPDGAMAALQMAKVLTEERSSAQRLVLGPLERTIYITKETTV